MEDTALFHLAQKQQFEHVLEFKYSNYMQITWSKVTPAFPALPSSSLAQVKFGVRSRALHLGDTWGLVLRNEHKETNILEASWA